MDGLLAPNRYMIALFLLDHPMGAIQVGAPPTFLEGVGAKHRLRSGRLTPSRKVGQRPLPLSAPT
jgi:hypothetical protein